MTLPTFEPFPNYLVIEINYPQDLILTQFEKAKKEDRKDLRLQEREKKKMDENKVRLFSRTTKPTPPSTWG